MFGLIFDIDGTITKAYGKESPIDSLVIKKISEIYNNGHRIAFVTGRAGWYIEENLSPFLKSSGLYDKVLISAERGVYKVENGKTFIDSDLVKAFTPYRALIKEEIIKTANEKGIPIKREELKKVPTTGEVWFEDKQSTLEVRTNHFNKSNLATEDRVYELASETMKRLGRTHDFSSFDVLKTSLSATVKLKNLNKYNVAKQVVETLNPDNAIEKWYVFGDSADDRTMADVNPEKMVFFDVRGKASAGVLEKLDELFTS